MADQYFDTVEAWRAAGSPEGTETDKVIIGSPPQSGDEWKPDFAQPNPYAGMPNDYAEEVAKSYVPTAVQPLSPVERAADAGQVSEVWKPAPVQIAGGEFISASDARRIQLQDKELYKVLVNEGRAAYRQAQDRKIAAEQFVRQKEANNAHLKSQKVETEEEFDRKWQRYLKGGQFTGTDAQYKIYQKDFEKFYVELPRDKGQYIKKQDLADLKEKSPDIYRVLTTQGMQAAEDYIQKSQAQYVGSLTRQGDIQKRLSQFGSDANGYNLPLALKSGRISEQELEEFGFDRSDIAAARKAMEASKNTGVNLEGESAYNTQLRAEQLKLEKDIDALAEKIRSEHPGISNKELNERLATSEEGKRLEVVSGQIQETGSVDLGAIKRGSANVATFFFPPAKSALPEYTMKDVTALDWGAGIANIAVMVVPLAAPATIAGRVVVGGVQLAAGGIYTASTVKDWGGMSTTEKVINVVVDTALIGGAFAGLGIAGKFKQAASATANKARNTITELFPKAKATEGGYSVVSGLESVQTVGRSNLLTEGGRIGPYANLTDSQLVAHVAAGRKPIAAISAYGDDVTALEAARNARLKLKYDGTIRLSKGDAYSKLTADGIEVVKVTKPTKIKQYTAYADNAESRLALDRLNRANAISTETPEGLIKFHTEVGKAYGYRPQDIRAYLHNLSRYDTGVRNALRKIDMAILTKDEHLLKQAASSLELSAGTLPKDIGNPIVKRMRQIRESPKEFINLAEKPPKDPDIVQKGLDANKQFIEVAERQLRRVKDKERKAAIQEALEQARTQVKKTAVKTKVRESWIEPTRPGQNLPSRVEPSSKVTPKAGKIIKVKPTKTTKLAPTPVGKGITQEKLREKARSSVVPHIVARQLPQLKPSEKAVPKPKQKPSAKPVPQPVPRPVPKTQLKPSEKAVPKPKQKPSAKPVPQPVPRPVPRPKPKPWPKPIPQPRTRMPPRTSLTPEGQKASREYIKESGGAIAWRQGQIGGKDRWDVIVNPYQSNEHYVMVLGDPPQGAIVAKGARSAYRTARLIRGIKGPAHQFGVDSGFQDVIVTPGDRKVTLNFKPDPLGKTDYPITIGRQTPRISQRTPRISQRTPALRR